MYKIQFREGTQEAFEAFADEVAEVLPQAVLTFHDKPKFGFPYVLVTVAVGIGHYPFIVDILDHLVVDGDKVNVETVGSWIS